MEIARIDEARLDQVPQAAWERLSRTKIFFGHQSVGANILDGLRGVLGRRSANLIAIRETSDPVDLEAPGLAHSLIGRNGDPRSKLEHFRAILESGVGGTADIAMVKLCFVDVDRTTDVESLFEFCSKTLSALADKFPRLRIVPWTVPLTTTPPGPRPAIKRLLGLAQPIAADNLPRYLFNEKIRAGYGASLFDLAEAEATGPDGLNVRLAAGGTDLELLDRAYSSDGGHLNELGSRIIAVDLLLFLARLVSA